MTINLREIQAQQIALKIIGLMIATKILRMFAAWIVSMPVPEARTTEVFFQTAVITTFSLAIIWILMRQSAFAARICFGPASDNAPWDPSPLSFWIMVASIHFLLNAIPSATVGLIYYVMDGKTVAAIILPNALAEITVSLAFLIGARIAHHSTEPPAPIDAHSH